MGWAQQLRDEGRQEGREEGLKQGIEQGIEQGREVGLAEGQRRLLTRLLTRRFGALPEEVLQKLSLASEAELTVWGEQLLLAGSLAEVFALAPLEE